MLDPLHVEIPIADVGPGRRPNWPTRKLLSPSPEHPDDYILEMDYSSASNFMVCPRKGENYSVKSREAQRDLSALNFGHLFHELDAKRLLIGFTEDFDKWKAEKIADHFQMFPNAPTDHRSSSYMETVFAGYKTRYDNDGLRQKLVQHNGAPFIERPFKIELMTIAVNSDVAYKWERLVKELKPESRKLPNGGLYIRNLHILYTGRIDSALIENNLYFVMDDKTSSRGGQEFEENFRLSLQTRMYCWALGKVLGKPIAGLILNAVITRAQTRTGKGIEYNRMTYFYQPDLIDEAVDDMKAHISYFVQCLIRGFFPQISLSFKSPCPSCDYHGNCSLPRHQREVDLASDLYRDVTWNPMFE